MGIHETIYTVNCGIPNYKIFRRKKVSSVIVYSYNKHIKIIPVQNEKIHHNLEIIVNLSFNVSDFVIDKNVNIFMASYNGFIYLLNIEANIYSNDKSSIQTKIIKLSKQSFLSPILNLFNINEL